MCLPKTKEILVKIVPFKCEILPGFLVYLIFVSGFSYLIPILFLLEHHRKCRLPQLIPFLLTTNNL